MAWDENYCWERYERAESLAARILKSRAKFLAETGNFRALRPLLLRKRADFVRYVADVWARRAQGWED